MKSVEDTYMVNRIDEVTEAQQSDREPHCWPIHTSHQRLGKVDECVDKLPK